MLEYIGIMTEITRFIAVFNIYMSLEITTYIAILVMNPVYSSIVKFCKNFYYNIFSLRTLF